MANECIPVYEPGGTVTARAAAALTGKTFCMISANADGNLLGLDTVADGGNIVVNKPSAGGRVFGVVSRDVASGGKASVICTPGIIVPVTVSAAVTYGQEVKVDANGCVLPVTGGAVAVGVAVASAATGDCPISIYGATPVGGATSIVAAQAAPAALTDSTGGAAADGTVTGVAAPTDAPATADALRDDIAAVLVPAINAALKELVVRENALRQKLIDAGVLT